MKIDWIFFPQSIIEKSHFSNKLVLCTGRSDDDDDDDDKMVNPFLSETIIDRITI